MATRLSAVPLEEQVLGLYDGVHLGLYFGIEKELKDHGITDKHLASSWMAGPSFQKLAADQAYAFYKLCVACLDFDPRMAEAVTGAKTLSKYAQTMEVGAYLYRNYATGELRFFVEPQVITGVTVESRSADPDRPLIDLLTGETMVNWQESWHEAGRAHSHNVMDPTPSSTDDESEIKTPGIYLIFGDFRRKPSETEHKFSVYASVVTPIPGTNRNMRRTHVSTIAEDGTLTVKEMDWDDVMEWDSDSKAVPHENVWKNILLVTPPSWAEKTTTVKSYSSGKGRSWKSKGTGYSATNGWNDHDDAIAAAIQEAGCKPSLVDWRLRLVASTISDLIKHVGLDNTVELLDGSLRGLQVGTFAYGHEDSDLAALADAAAAAADIPPEVDEDEYWDTWARDCYADEPLTLEEEMRQAFLRAMHNDEYEEVDG